MDDLLKQQLAEAIDRLRMSNPDVQGPQLPTHTPTSDEYYGAVTGAVAGSLNPVNGARMPATTGREIAARGVADDVIKAAEQGLGGMDQDAVRVAQQVVGREANFAARARDQAAAARAAKFPSLSKSLRKP